MTQRRVLSVTGSDREHFLQGLVTNDVLSASGALVYAALLTPQGKYIADFFMLGQTDRILIDVDDSLAAPLAQRLSMYRLRADVQIAATDLVVSRGTGPAPDGALQDPRHAALGWRSYGPAATPDATDRNAAIPDATDWDEIRVTHLIPESGIELTPDSYILEWGFERLHGVDFRKGCYVGQEVTARMKHKTDLKKGLASVRIDGRAPPGTPIMAGDKEAGTLYTQAGDRAIAWLRFDRAKGPLTAGDAQLDLIAS